MLKLAHVEISPFELKLKSFLTVLSLFTFEILISDSL